MKHFEVCNTGIVGYIYHARRPGEVRTLCGKPVYTPNRGDNLLPLSEVQCQRCRKAMEKEKA